MSAPAALTTAPVRSRLELLRARFDGWFRPDPRVRPPVRREVLGVLALWVTGRAVNFLFLGGWYLVSRAASWGFGPDNLPVRDFLSFLTSWDADRYGRIANYGYPTILPTDADGRVQENNWAFLPIYPYLQRAFSDLTGMGWQLSGVIVSLAFSAAATVMLFLLLRAVTAPRQASWAVVLFTFSPVSFVFALAYAESLSLLLLFAALLLAVKRRYVWIAPVGVLAAFTRPGVLALSLALGLLFLVRVLRRRVDPFRPAEAAGLVVAGLATAIAGLSWTWIADLATGVPGAYILTETAWWIPLVGDITFVPLTPWFIYASTYLGVIGIILVLGVLVLFGVYLASPQARRLGFVVWSFALSYGLYLFAVFLPQQSTFRLLLPISPLLADERLCSTRRRRVGILTGSIVLQFVAVLLLWTVGYP